MWGDIAAWFQSAEGARVLQTMILPALAILVAGLIAALIARGTMRSVMRRADRQQGAAAVAGLVEAARATIDAESRGDRRRAARLRAEADVQVRLLPLKGAARAADWAAARTEQLQGDPDATAGIAQLRDALVAWVDSPARARRLFAVLPEALVLPQADSAQPDFEQPDSTLPDSTLPDSTLPDSTLPDSPLPESSAPGETESEVPAWRRTRSAERLQQLQAAAAEPREDTAPVRLQRAHRAEPAPIAEVEQLEQVGSHQASRFARPVEAAEPERTEPDEDPADVPAAADRPGPRRRAPEWLDDYDDEAHVTQNLDLRTPPPMAASKVRDRAPVGDIVPRT